jgi:hypothetical protein
MATENIYNLPQWETPEYYGGFNPIGDYVIYSQHRDSDALSRSNYRRTFEDLINYAETLNCQDKGTDGEGDESDMVYDFRAGHWAVGWVETILICQNAPDKLQAMAREIIDALADYPVYDESDYSELEWNEVQDYWQSLSIADRIEYIRDNGGNIFAARHDFLSENADPNGSIFDSIAYN